MDVRVEVKIEEIDEVIALFNKNFPILPSTKAEWLLLDKAVDYSIDLTVDILPGSFDGHISFGIYRPNDDMGYRTQVSCIRDHNYISSPSMVKAEIYYVVSRQNTKCLGKSVSSHHRSKLCYSQRHAECPQRSYPYYRRNYRGFIHICQVEIGKYGFCLLYTSPSPRDRQKSRMPSSA